jgi:ribosomal protein S14
MKQSLKSNIIRRKRFYKDEFQKKMLKWGLARLLGQKRNYLLSQTQHARNLRIQKQITLSLMNRNADASVSKIKSMCYVSKRSRGVSRAFRLSRMSFKEQMQKEYFVGVTRYPAK